MNTTVKLLISLLLLSCRIIAQQVSGIYKINDLLIRTSSPDTMYVINFWASWCKPCIKELPAFDSLATKHPNSNLKVLLVCLDFKEDIGTRVNSLLKNKHIRSECVLLDEVNGNDYIDKVDPLWSGAIPVTCFRYGSRRDVAEKKLRLQDLEERIRFLKSL